MRLWPFLLRRSAPSQAPLRRSVLPSSRAPPKLIRAAQAHERLLRRDVPAPGLTEHEKYLFDLHGYLVVKAALSPEQLADCRARLAERVAASPEQQRFGSGRASNAKRESDGAEEAWRAANVIEWGGAYLDLIDLPTVVRANRPQLRSSSRPCSFLAAALCVHRWSSFCLSSLNVARRRPPSCARSSATRRTGSTTTT